MRILVLTLLALLSAGVALADPPTPHNVNGFVSYANGTRAENGIAVLIRDVTASTQTLTAVFAPPIPSLAGAYAGTISGADGDTILVYAYNSTHYGNNTVTLNSTTAANVTLGTQRAPEPNVSITYPLTNATFNGNVTFNVTANITVLGADGTCNATVAYSTGAIGSTLTVQLGTVSRGTNVQVNFTASTLAVGVTSINVSAACSPLGPILEARTSDAVHNITVVDTVAPNVTLISPANNTLRTVDNMPTLTYRVSDFSSIANCTLVIDGSASQTNTTVTRGIDQSFSVALPNGQHNWSVACTDAYGNTDASPSYNITIAVPNIAVTGAWYEGVEIEGVNVTLFANVTNDGLLATGTFTVRFFETNVTVGDAVLSLAPGQNATVNATLTLHRGVHAVLVAADVGAIVNETSEADNNVTFNITVSAYQVYYGNVSQNVTLDVETNETFYQFSNNPTLSGHVFIADVDSSFSFSDLVAMARTTGGSPTADDFTDMDALLNMTGFNDSVRNVWGGGSDTPLLVASFNLSTGLVANVPIVNTTASFVTGILWDGADDSGGGQFDQADAEDLVFVAPINESQAGLYGTYDYEMRVPSSLKGYVAGTDAVLLYYEIG